MNIRLLVFLSLLLPLATLAQREGPKTRILFIYDASNSMNGTWQSGVKHQTAQKVLARTVDSLNTVPNLEIALRVYGHQKNYRLGQDCNDTRLEVPFAPNNANKIKSKLKSITPQGTTPIAMTLEKAAGDFTDCKNCRNIIILITDGIEECGGDPCTISMKLQRKGIILKPFVIGIGLDLGFKKSFECMGTFFDASNEAQLKEVLGMVISQAMNQTTAQVSLIDANGFASESDVAFTLRDHFSGREIKTAVHTLNAKGFPDTLYLDPIYTYDLIVHTIPEVRVDSLIVLPGKHNILGADAPQGHLVVNTKGNIHQKIQYLIKPHNKHEIVHVEALNAKVKLITGFYDIEMLTIPRLTVKDVAISQSHTTNIDIPTPGVLSVSRNGRTSAYLLHEKEDGSLERVYTFAVSAVNESIHVMPGDYRIVYRSVGAKSTEYSNTKYIKIKEGASASVSF